MGDLNYRIDQIPELEVKSMLENNDNNDMELLLGLDQVCLTTVVKKPYYKSDNNIFNHPIPFSSSIGKDGLNRHLVDLKKVQSPFLLLTNMIMEQIHGIQGNYFVYKFLLFV